MAITQVANKDNQAEITLINMDKMAFPATLELGWKDGTKQRINVPIETWLQGGTRVLHIPISQPLISVTIDPDQPINPRSHP